MKRGKKLKYNNEKMEQINKNSSMEYTKKDRRVKEIARKKERKFMELSLIDQSAVARRNIYEMEVLSMAMEYISNTAMGLVDELEEKDIELESSKKKLNKAENILGSTENKKAQNDYFNFSKEVDKEKTKSLLENKKWTPKKQESFKQAYLKYNLDAMNKFLSGGSNYQDDSMDDSMDNHGKLRKTTEN